MALSLSLPTGLLHCWDLEEESGDRIDHVQQTALTPQGTVWRGEGKVGSGTLFDGSGFLLAPSGLPQVFGPPFTVACWFRLTAFPGLDSMTLMGKGNSLAGGQYQLALLVHSDTHQVMLAAGGGLLGYVSHPLVPLLGVWYLAVGWHTGTGVGGGTINLQINNGEIASAGGGNTSGPVMANFTLGAIGLTGRDRLQGTLDSVMIWNRALTSQGERDVLWNGGGGVACVPVPVLICPEPPWAAVFHDALLDPYISYGCKLKLKFQTYIARMREGHEERIGEWQDPLWTFDITPALRDQADLDYLIAFFRARNGPEFIFKFLNPLDYQVQGQVFGTGDGVTTVFQLCRHYPTGLQGDGLYYVRPVLLPAQGAQVYDNGVLVPDGNYVVCPLGGTVMFVTAPAAGHTLTWSGMYYTPVRFFTNRIYSVVEHYEHFEDQIGLIEERLAATAPVLQEAESPDFVEVRLPTLYAQRATMGPELNVVTITSDSGGTSRTIQFKDAKIRFTVEETEQPQAVIESLLAFFLNRKGRLYGFRAKDITDFELNSQVMQPADGVRTEFQLVKNYPSGAQNQVRTITKPCADVTIMVGGVLANPQPTIDLSTGTVTFASPPAAGQVITCTGTFDVPVRFDSDEAVFSIQGFEAFNLEAIGLLESELGLPQFTIEALATT